MLYDNFFNLYILDLSQKVFYVCCLLVTTGGLCKTLQCPMKDNKMPWKNPCGTEGIEHKSSLPHNAADRTWITNFISVLKEINDFFIELKLLIVSKLYRQLHEFGLEGKDTVYLFPRIPLTDPL